MQSKSNNTLNKIILFLIIFQSLGIRLFQGIGITLLIAIFILSFSKTKWAKVLKPFAIMEIIYLALSLTKGIEGKLIIINSFAMLDACMFLSRYKDINYLLDDLYSVLRIYCLQGLISIPIYFLIPKNLLITVPNLTDDIRTFAYIFYYGTTKSILGFPRISGWCWEPGTFQMTANLLLLLKIMRREKIKDMIWVVLVILSTFSTLGYICLLFNTLAAIWNGKRKVLMTFVVVISIPLFSSIIISNFSEKLADDNTSGLIRQRDMFVGWTILKDHPITGFNIDNIEQTAYGQNIEDIYWATTSLAHYTQTTDTYLAGGFTNGFFTELLTYGIPVGLFIFYCIYKIPIFENRRERISLLVIWILTLQSEPVSISCSFFYLFVMLGFSNMLRERQIKNSIRRKHKSIKVARSFQGNPL